MENSRQIRKTLPWWIATPSSNAHLAWGLQGFLVSAQAWQTNLIHLPLGSGWDEIWTHPSPSQYMICTFPERDMSMNDLHCPWHSIWVDLMHVVPLALVEKAALPHAPEAWKMLLRYLTSSVSPPPHHCPCLHLHHLSLVSPHLVWDTSDPSEHMEEQLAEQSAEFLVHWLAMHIPSPYHIFYVDWMRADQVGMEQMRAAQIQMGLQKHIMDSYGLCHSYSQPMASILHHSYSSQCWPTLRFLYISYISQHQLGQWSLVHSTDHLAFCGMVVRLSGFVWHILYDWKAVMCSFPTV